MRKNLLTAYGAVFVAALALTIFPVQPGSISAAYAPESNNTELSDVQTFTAAHGSPAPLERESYSATTAQEVEAIREERQAQEAAAKKSPAVDSSASAAPPSYSGGGSPAEWMAAAGIAESDWGYVDYIVSKESGWNPNAVNKSSGASGLVQALPCGKVPGSCFNPVDNLRWANGYAVGRYGSWAGAYQFWTTNHWW